MLQQQGIAGCLLAAGIFLNGLFYDSTEIDRAGGGSPSAVAKTPGEAQTFWVEQVVDGLNFPSAMVWLPNGDMLITERMGGLRRVRRGRLDPRPVSGVPASFQSGLADGLRDILLDPDYPTNQTLYLLMSEGAAEGRHAAVYRARFTDTGLKEVKRIFRSRGEVPVSESGTVPSRMIFLADKTLLVAVAEDAKERAQDLDSDMGKILRINRDGSIPDDNPFKNKPGALPEIWSYGHRVILGLYREPNTGAIWDTEAGPRGGDELNALKPGANYGWPKVSWGFRYDNTGSWAPKQSDPGVQDPLVLWTPSVTPSGLTRYRGSTYPLWDGDYFVGHLSGKELERLRIRGARVQVQERLLWDLEERIRDVKVGPDNHLYVLTDHQNGRLLRLRPGQPLADQLPKVAHRLANTFTPPSVDVELGDPVKGRQLFLARCAACHSVGDHLRGGAVGPDLAGVFGRRAGSQPDFGFSKGMIAAGFEWNSRSLDRFLANPTAMIAGTTMMSAPVTDGLERRQIIGFLRQPSE